MGRLIDAKELLRRWDELSIRGRIEFDQIIMLMPTAYDVDYVIDELKNCHDVANSQSVDYMDELSDAYEKAIDIVKLGFTNERGD